MTRSKAHPLRAALPFVLIGVLALGGCAEYLPFSGGGLEGSVAANPASFEEIGRQKIVQLETNPTEPYSVNLWVIGNQDSLYIFAGDSETTWVRHIAVDPNVRLKIGESIYELAATRVTDAEEFEQFAQAWESKYGNRPRNENVEETWLLRLAAR